MITSTRTHFALLTSLATLGAGALGVGVSTAVAAKPKPVKLQLHTSSLGKILVAGSGATVYMFTHDKKNRDTCVGINGCTAIWPVLKSSGKPRAGKGVKASLLGTITLAHGVKQATYAGHPLYTYSGDVGMGPAQTSYAGTPEFGGTWYAVGAGGHAVK